MFTANKTFIYSICNTEVACRVLSENDSIQRLVIATQGHLAKQKINASGSPT